MTLCADDAYPYVWERTLPRYAANMAEHHALARLLRALAPPRSILDPITLISRFHWGHCETLFYGYDHWPSACEWIIPGSINE